MTLSFKPTTLDKDEDLPRGNIQRKQFFPSLAPRLLIILGLTAVD